MAKYRVVIMGDECKDNWFEKEVKGFITVDGGQRIVDGFVDLCDITFKPLELFGDLRYMAENKYCNKTSAEDMLYYPYDNEPCLNNMEIADKEKYFKLLNEIKEIVHNDKKLSILDVRKIAESFKVSMQFELDFAKEIDENELTCYEGQNKTYRASDKIKYEQRDYMYVSCCNDISDIIIAVLTYLVLFNYHFYQCKHCKRYSAELRHQKDRRYCMRTNMLDIPYYENICCREAVPKVLNLIYTKYRRKKKYLRGILKEQGCDGLAQTEKEYNELEEIYKQKIKVINDNPSSDNINWLISYLDNIDSDRRKKRK